MRGLIIGRFQPFHNGHAEVVKKFSEHELIFAVGSAYQSLSFDNPFTAGERIEMIRQALQELKMTNKSYIIPVPDINRHGIYGSHVKDLVPTFDFVISNNPVIHEIFEREGITVRQTPFIKRDLYQGTVIRRLISDKENWDHLVPESVKTYINQIKGDIRIRNLCNK